MELEQWLGMGVISFMLLFARLGTALMLLPVTGSDFIPPRIRLLFALAFTALMAPLLGPDIPASISNNYTILAGFIMSEIVIGALIGLSARFLLFALEIAGTVMGFQMGLSNAFMLNPAVMIQSSVISTFFIMSGLVLLFATNMHHHMLEAVIRSYAAFPVGELPVIGDMAEIILYVFTRTFAIGVQMAAPLIAIGLMLQVGTGVINRLMPQVQIFFVIVPLQISLGFLLMTLTATAFMMFWLEQFSTLFPAVLYGGG